MERRPFFRALALVLAAQPVFWTGGVAKAQALEQLRPRPQPDRFPDPSGPGRPFAGSASPGDGEPSRPERAAQTLNLPPPVDEPLDPDRYVCGPGDVLELNFWGVENFRLRVPVDLEGRAFVPKVGFLPLRGKTLSEAQRLLREAAARYFPRLQFGVSLAEARTFLVQVVDDVARPASYPARAIDRVATLLGRAGGLGPNASLRRIEVQRRDGSVVQADLLRYAQTGDVKHNPYVLDGDVVRVPFQTLVASIGGAVNRPGRYELVGKADLEELVELAGGLAPVATRALPITVLRRTQDEKLKRLLFDFAGEGQLPSIAIAREDSVFVPAFPDLQVSVTLTGALAGVGVTAGIAGTTTALGLGVPGGSPGDETAATRHLPFAEGDTAGALLERVGGVGPLADLKNSFILRRGQALPLDLYALIMLRDRTADRPVELGDTVVVPFRRTNVLVEGAVFRPGPYVYNPTYRVEQYLAQAGGLNRFAKGLDDVYLVTPRGEMKQFAADLKVEPGGTLVVPERNFSRAEVVSIILAAAGVLLSGTAIIITARK